MAGSQKGSFDAFILDQVILFVKEGCFSGCAFFEIAWRASRNCGQCLGLLLFAASFNPRIAFAVMHALLKVLFFADCKQN